MEGKVKTALWRYKYNKKLAVHFEPKAYVFYFSTNSLIQLN